MTIIKKQWFKNNSNTSNNGNVKCKNARFSNDNSDILINELSLLHELQFTSYCILHELLLTRFLSWWMFWKFDLLRHYKTIKKVIGEVKATLRSIKPGISNISLTEFFISRWLWKYIPKLVLHIEAEQWFTCILILRQFTSVLSLLTTLLLSYYP